MAAGSQVNERELDVLVTVKAYPNPSRTLAEAACIAGVDREHRFIRLYPIPFRNLEDQQQFRKYEWIRLRARRPRSDPRPETLRPDFATISVLSEPLPTTDAWAARRDAVLPAATASLCDIGERQRADRTSLGIFRPAEVLDFTWEREPSPEWTNEQKARLAQGDLFITRERKPLEKMPFTFRYRFRCVACRSKEPHHMKIVDWELAQQFRRLQRECATIEGALQKLRENWLDNLCGREKDTHLFVGNMQAFPRTFLVLGVFWPPKRLQVGLFNS